MDTGVLAGLLPESIMHTEWFAALTMFVAINTLLYLTLAVVKLLPKAYLSDWVDRRDRRGETRSIHPDADAPAPSSVSSHAESSAVVSGFSTRIEVIGMRVVYGLAGDDSGEFSVGRSVCQFGAVGVGGGAPDDGASDPDRAAVVADPTFTG